MHDVDVTIRRAEGLEDYLACVTLQKVVWGYTEMEDIAAQPLLMIGDKFGGCLLMALDSTGRHVGFTFAMPVWKPDKRIFWWSHMTAVLPEYRNREVGLALKSRQRQEALKEGIDLVEWTFDPLQALNAHFNLARLGVIVTEYKDNVYGYTSSPLHRGLPTDRFVAEWHLNSERIRQRLDSTEQSVIKRDLDRMPRINAEDVASNLELHQSPLLLEIPVDLDELRKTDLEKAKRWQDTIKTACRHYFHAGYIITDFIRIEETRTQGFYVLELSRQMQKLC